MLLGLKGQRTAKDNIMLQVQVSFIYLSILLMFTNSLFNPSTYLEFCGIWIVYSFTWYKLDKILGRLHELEEHAIVCAWCGSVKHAGEYTAVISHGICPNCTETQMKELSKIKENICIQKNSHNV